MKRMLFVFLLAMAAALMLTGCASNADAGATASPAPMTQGTVQPILPSNIPQTTDEGILGDLLDGDHPGITTSEDALKVSQELRNALQRLTEVDTAAAVAVGNTALVGVTYDSSYQGGLDDRLRGMMLDRAQAAHSGITRVAATDKAEDISEIASLYQMLQSGSAYATVKADADALIARLELYQK